MSDLENLGYRFDDQGVLRTIKENKKFEFTSQTQYEELGEAVTEKVYQLLQHQCGLKKQQLLPADGTKVNAENTSFIFISPEHTDKNTLLVLLHGSGVVRAGQWARRLIINDNLRAGTQIPYIERAMDNDWGVVVLNSNHLEDDSGEPLKYSSTVAEHCSTAWEHFVKNTSAETIYIVAHSRGGYDTLSLLRKFGTDERIKVVCLTDSGSFDIPSLDRTEPLFAVNFIASGKGSDYRLKEFRRGSMQEFYAGTKIHEWSSHFVFAAIFHILENNINLENYDEILNRAKVLVTKTEEDEDESAPKKRRKNS